MIELEARQTSAYAGGDDDADLVARAVAGDRGAYDLLFQSHYRRVYNLAHRLAGNADAAQDLAQAAFIRAYQALHTLRDGRLYLKFVYRILVNLVRDRARSEQRRPLVGWLDLFRSGDPGDGEPEAMSEGRLDPSSIVEHDEFQRQLAARISDLPLEFREALVLHHMEGLDIREIAGIAGVPEGTVKSRIARARTRLQKAMAPWMAGEA